MSPRRIRNRSLNNDRPFDVIIKLDQESDACVFSKPHEIIHQNELKNILGLIRLDLDKAEKFESKYKKENSGITERVHNTITLSGSRGTGKTTFILSLFKFIENNTLLDHNTKTYDFNSNLEILEIIDPTLIEEKGNVFINIIARIKEKVTEKAKELKCFGGEKNENLILFNEWNETLEGLAEGLPGIPGIGSESLMQEWHDSEFIMQHGIRRISAANNLEKNFHKYIFMSLKFLNKKAFLIVFDDIDTNFDKGWPVLETLRKYITTPQIITILSGDLALYTLLIRKNQLDNFGKNNKTNDSYAFKEYENFSNLLTDVEQQYILKILKPERRLFLTSLHEKIENGLNIGVVKEGQTEPTNLVEYYNEIFIRLGIASLTIQKTYYQFLAILPMRSQMQIFSAFSDNNFSVLQFRLTDIFNSDLSNKRIDTNLLRDSNELVIIQSLKYLVDNNILREGYTFRPVFPDRIINSVQFTLGSLISLSFRNNPANIFEYLIRIGISREIDTLLNKSNSNVKDPNDHTISIQEYLAFCDVLNRKSIRNVSRMANSFIQGLFASDQGSKNPSYIKLGSVQLAAFAFKQNETVEKTQNRFDAIFKNQSLLTKIIGHFSLSVTTNHKGQSTPLYSIYNLLGVIGEILNTLKTHNNANTKETTSELLKIFIKDSQIREYPVPVWALGGLSKPEVQSYDDDLMFDDSEETKITDEYASSKEIENFIQSIIDWHAKYDANIIPAYLIAKISTRFFYVLNRFEKIELLRLGDIMHMFVVIFLHSVLVEDGMEYLPGNISSKISLVNPFQKDRVFRNNLKNLNASIEKNPEYLHLSKWLLACPIWYCFLSDDKDLRSLLLDFTGFNGFSSINLYEILNQVQLKSSKTEPVINKIKTITEPSRSLQEIRPQTTKRVTVQSFTVSNTKHLNKLVMAFREFNMSVEHIKNMSPQVLRNFMIEKFENVYFNITTNTSRAVQRRINNGILKW